MSVVVEHDIHAAVQVREMCLEDLPAVKPLCQALVEHVQSCGQETTFVWNEKKIARDMFGNPRFLYGFVAVYRGEIVGYTFAALGYEVDQWRREYEVLDLYIKPDARRLGLGPVLLGQNISKARELECEQLRALVYKDNEEMLGIFKKTGADMQDYHVLCRLPLDEGDTRFEKVARFRQMRVNTELQTAA